MEDRVPLRNYGVLKNMPQLDGLRAIAVFMVMYAHWMPWSYRLGLPWGNTGVDLFFVLSGFLITRILLKCRGYVDNGGQSVLSTAGRFYARRCLRILPIYFAVLLAYTVVARQPMNELTPWLWTFTLNLYRVFINDLWGGPISHFWSLSVEEQFYLVWPLVIFVVPRRLLLHALIFSVIVGPATKIIMATDGWSVRAIRYFTLSCFETLAVGAVLAYLVDAKFIATVGKSRFINWLLWIGVPTLAAGTWLQTYRSTFAEHIIVFSLGSSLLLGWIVVKAALGFHGITGRLLSARPLTYIGKISYGMYLIHKPLPVIIQEVGIPLNAVPPFIMFLIYSTLTVAIASLSWHYFESPINGLKRYFPYKPKSYVAETSQELA